MDDGLAAMISDEAHVLPYQLPDPLVCEDGSPVRTVAQWRQRLFCFDDGSRAMVKDTPAD